MSEEELKKIEIENEQMNAFFDKVLTLSLTDLEKNRISEKFVFEKISPFYTPRDRFPVYTKAPHVWYEFMMSGKFVAGALSFVLMLSGATSVAAKSAIPGDILYPIKIYINEGAESFFSIGVKSTAKTNATHAISRLKEVQKLALQDKLSTTTTNLIKAKFTEDAQSVALNVEKLSQEGDVPAATEVGTEFQASLQDYQSTLATLSEKGGEQEALLNDIVGTVTTHLNATVAVNLSVELASNEAMGSTTAISPMSSSTAKMFGLTATSTTSTSTPATPATSTPEKATSTGATKTLKIKTP